MPFLGKQPTSGFASIVKDDLTGNGTTGPYTLSKQVANANDIAVFVGNVRQEPTDAYTVNGNQLTMTGTVSSSINFYVLHIAGTLESSVIPADATISTAKLQPSAVTDAKIAASTITNAKLAGSITDAKLSTPGAFKFISRTVVTTSVASVDFDNLSTDYDTFWVTFMVHPNSDNVGLRVRFLDSSGAEIGSSSLYGASAHRFDDSASHISSNAQNYIPLSGTNVGNAQHEGVSGNFFLHNRNFNEANDQHPPHIVGMSNQTNTSGNSNQYNFGGGLANNPAQDIRGVKLYFSSGSIEEGVVALYGVVKS